jgi:hypothetical protein
MGALLRYTLQHVGERGMTLSAAWSESTKQTTGNGFLGTQEVQSGVSRATREWLLGGRVIILNNLSISPEHANNYFTVSHLSVAQLSISQITLSSYLFRFHF